MKILHIGEYVKGGVATYIRTLLRYQVLANDVYLLMSNSNSEKEWPLSNQNLFYYKYERSLSNIFPAIFEIYRYIKNIQPDIIHIHSSWAGLFVRVIYFFLGNRPKIVYCAHGWSFLMDTSLIKKYIYVLVERVLAYQTDIIINISKYEHIQSLKLGLPKHKSKMIYNGLDEVDTIKESKAKSDNISTTNKIKLLFVGRFDKQKGLDLLLRFFSNNKIEHIELYVIGDKVLNNTFVTIPQGVHYLGWIENASIDYYYQTCDAVIMPSRWEGFGLVAVEAMRNKKAVIASNRGALPELVINDFNGYIFDIDNMNELKEIFQRINKDELSIKGNNGYNLFKKKFISQKLNDNIINIYQSLLCP